MVAYAFFGYYGGFSLSDFFARINPDELILLVSFLVFMALLATIFKRLPLFKDAYGNPEKGTIVVISVCVALLASYGIYISGYVYQIENFFYNIQFSLNLLGIIVAVVVIFFILRFLGIGVRRRPRTI